MPLVQLRPAVAGLALAAVLLAPTPVGAAGDLPVRDLHDKVVLTRQHVLLLKGRVDPGHGPVVIRKRDCRTCPWRRYAVVRTDDESRWRVRIRAPRHGSWFWQGVVTAYGGYGRSTTATWRTWTH